MTFDPATFMNQSTQGKMDTVIAQCPEGEYKALIDDFDASAFRTFQSKKDGKDFTVFSPPFVIQDASVAATLGREKVTVFHKGMFIDIDAAGGLDTSKGKNVDLGRLREALGQNVDGPWTFNNLKGAGPVMVKVVHESDKDDPEKKYARITKVVKIG
jgi:hypothetical protein